MPTRRLWTLGFAAVVTIGALLSGCASPVQSAAAPLHKVHKAADKPTAIHGTMPQFENLLLMDPTPLVKVLNTMPVISVKADEHIRVQTSSGKWISLNAMQHPTLFVAYWCPHCQRTLVMLEHNRSKIAQWPTIVFTGYPPGFPLQWAKAIAREEQQALHLPTIAHADFLIGNDDMKYITGFPYLMFVHRGQLTSLVGEHTFSVWQQALARP